MKRSQPVSGYCFLAIFLAMFSVDVDAGGQEPLAIKSWLQFGHHTNWQSSLRIDSDAVFAIAWDIEVGAGRSQVVGVDNEIYVSTGTATKEGEQTNLSTRIAAIDLNSGKEKWNYEQTSIMFNTQETFGGATAAPQATAVIASEQLITVSFSGQLICLDRNRGEPVWKMDLVSDLGAEPVQYGFSASPVFDPLQPDRVQVLAAGEKAGFYCLNIKDGSIIWKSELDSSGYATPVSAKFGDVSQWIVVSENEVIGIAKQDGTRLWRYELPAPGLTNVPTPIVVDDRCLVISGQGCQGTRLLTISRQGATWSVDEKWFAPRLQFFYTNWLKLNNQLILGCTDKYLAAVDASDGRILGRWRGYGDGNVTYTGGKLLVLDGKGNLSVLDALEPSALEPGGFVTNQKFKMIDARCWTPISIINDRILIRGDDRLVCVTISKNLSGTVAENLLSAPNKLQFEKGAAQTAESDPVELIFATFETKGQDAALSLYAKFRMEKVLDETARVALAEAAQEQDLKDVAKMIIGHAVTDFPDSKEIKSAAQKILGK